MDFGLSTSLSIFIPLLSKLEALKEGLQIALSNGFTLLIIETDSTEVIQILDKGNESNYMNVNYCRWLMHRLKQTTVHHNFRDGNQVVHGLVNEALEKAWNTIY